MIFIDRSLKILFQVFIAIHIGNVWGSSGLEHMRTPNMSEGMASQIGCSKECFLESAVSNSDGTIVIGQWMRDLCASEDELAAIVAHEKAHLVLKHGEKTWYEKIGEWFTGWFVDESKPRFCGPPDPKSVARENEADAKGLMLMAEAGYDPQAAVSFWTRYYERTGWWEGDGTHPKPRERLAHLNGLMPEAKKLYIAANNKKQKESEK